MNWPTQTLNRMSASRFRFADELSAGFTLKLVGALDRRPVTRAKTNGVARIHWPKNDGWRSLPPPKRDRRMCLRKLVRRSFFQLAAKLFPGALAVFGFLAPENFTGGRNRFAHPGQADGNSLRWRSIRCGGQC